MAAGKQAAVQAQQQQAQMQAEQAANAKKGEAFFKRSVVPSEERGACARGVRENAGVRGKTAIST